MQTLLKRAARETFIHALAVLVLHLPAVVRRLLLSVAVAALHGAWYNCSSLWCARPTAADALYYVLPRV